MILTLAEEAEIPDLNRIGWHSCRKSQADSTLELTGSMDAVRTLLGHTLKSRSTNFYLSSRPDNRRPGPMSAHTTIKVINIGVQYGWNRKEMANRALFLNYSIYVSLLSVYFPTISWRALSNYLLESSN